jgi:hypothetical protein
MIFNFNKNLGKKNIKIENFKKKNFIFVFILNF